jgi:hypothetical protein
MAVDDDVADRRPARSRLSDVRFPLLAFVVWRAAQEVLLRAAGGQHKGTLFVWDGSWYKLLWDHGYDFEVPGGRLTNFFPLLAWLARGLNVLIPNDELAANVIVTVAAVAAVCLVHLTLAAWRGEVAARWGTVLLLLFPASFFLRQFYTEGLFLAFTAGALLAHERTRPWVAAACAAGGTLTRVPGVAVVAVLVASAVIEDGHVSRRAAIPMLGLVGLVPVMVAQGLQAGSPLDFLVASEAWGRHLDGPWYPFIRGWQAITGDDSHSVTVAFDLAAVVLFIGLTVLAFVRRWPWPARLLMVAMVAIPMTQHFVTSLGRYMVAAWPGFGVAGEWLAGRDRPVKVGVTLSLALASLVFLRLAHFGAFVG